MKKIFKGTIFVALVFCIPLFLYVYTVYMGMSNTTYAATSDSDDTLITLNLSQQILITDLSDVTVVNPTASIYNEDNVCVWSNIPDYSYEVAGNGANDSGVNFRLKDSGTNYITYTVWWKSVIPISISYEQLAPGVSSGNAYVANSSSSDCSGHTLDNARLNLRVPFSNIEAAPAGTYTDTLVIEVGSK